MTDNVEELRRAAGPGGELRPVPDPTKLTTEQLRRELATLREIIETRLDGMDLATGLANSQTNMLREEIEQIRARLREETSAEIVQLRQLLETRLDGMNPAIEQLRQLLQARLDGMNRAIELQFTDRDIRAQQVADNAQQALAAALSAQKELVDQQNEANSAAAAKAEASFTKQIDQIGTIIQTMEKATDTRITELKERIDRGEGSTAGAAGFRTERRLDTGQVLTTLSVLAAVIGLLILAFRH